MAVPDPTLDFLLSGLSGVADSTVDEPGDPNIDPAPVGTQEIVATDINAELAQMSARGIDPRTRFKQEDGLLGKSDVFSYETEKEFSPKVREFVRRFYGPAEIQYNPDAGMLSNLWTRMFGSAPNDEEKKQIAQAQQLAQRGSGSASSKYKRMMEEIHKGTPSAAEVRGDIPKDMDLPPWLQSYARKGRKIELPKYQAKVLLRDYGIVQGGDVDQDIIKKARVASNSINQLEGISPGLAKNTLGPILAEDFNVHFGLKGTDGEVDLSS